MRVVATLVGAAMAFLSSGLLALLASDLLDLKDHELGGIDRGHADDDVDDALRDVGGRGGRAVAVDEVGLGGRGALERSLGIEPGEEVPPLGGYLGPQLLVVWLEDHPFEALDQALLDVIDQ